MPPKTVSRKVSAIRNYFRWLTAEGVLAHNPAEAIKAEQITSPLPDLLYEGECQQLLQTASRDPRTYLLVSLLLETGLKKAELMALRVTHFDFSNRYQPELWVKHSGKQVFKDRKLKLPASITPAFDDYVQKYQVTDLVFPCSPQFVSQLLRDIAREAGVRKQISAGILRDTFVVRSVQQGVPLAGVLEKIGLSDISYESRKKYERLTRKAV